MAVLNKRTGSAASNWRGGPVERICQLCGNAFFAIRRTPSVAHPAKFCSVECRGRARIAQVEKECEQCNRKFEVDRWKGNTARFCSRQCTGNSQRKQYAVIRCLQCGDEFTTRPSKIHKFCSPACAVDSKRQSDGDRQARLKKHSHLKRARKMAAEGQFTKEEWLLLKRQYHHRCPCCGRAEPDIRLTVDHIVPLSKGGTNWISNIQPLCLSCNSRKHNKEIRYTVRLRP